MIIGLNWNKSFRLLDDYRVDRPLDDYRVDHPNLYDRLMNIALNYRLLDDYYVDLF